MCRVQISRNAKSVFKPTGLKDKDLPESTFRGRRYSFDWAEGYDSALKKAESLKKFESTVLKKLMRGRDVIEQIYQLSAKKSRYNSYLDLRSWSYGSVDKLSGVRDKCLIKGHISDRKECFDHDAYRDKLQPIGNDYVDGE